MLSVSPGRRVWWLCVQPTDMRRSFDGLAAVVRQHLGEDPSNAMVCLHRPATGAGNEYRHRLVRRRRAEGGARAQKQRIRVNAGPAFLHVRHHRLTYLLSERQPRLSGGDSFYWNESTHPSSRCRAGEVARYRKRESEPSEQE
jgi:hypothetical protein